MTARELVHLPGPRGSVVQAARGPRLLDRLDAAAGLAGHRALQGALPRLGASELVALVRGADIRGRGGAGFPLARKIETVAGRPGRPVVVVNISEGEPASHKDMTLALVAPHTILDGAVLAARALGARDTHVVVPSDQPTLVRTVRKAVGERHDPRIRWHLHQAGSWFVAGQARAVIELMSGRENLPVTAWQPEAMHGYRGRPTLLSNAETFAQLATLVRLGAPEYRRLGSPTEPGTCLLTLNGDTWRPRVREVPLGTRWAEVLAPEELERPVLVGGYHGTWAAAGELAGLTVSREDLARRHLTLGAGVVLPLAAGDCPMQATARITDYLAGQSAGRCGPCVNGLPALAETVRRLCLGTASTERVERLAALVTGRGACAHPDGTARLVRSLLEAYGDEVDAHRDGYCTFAERTDAVRLSADRRAG